MKETFLIGMCVLFAIGYFKVCFKIDKNKIDGVYWIFLMTFLFAISMLLTFSSLHRQKELEKELVDRSKGLPQYEEVHGVYIIKKE